MSLPDSEQDAARSPVDAPPKGDADGELHELRPELPTDDLVGQVLVGRYRVLKLLGVGGMAAVYQAEHVHMRKLVALKVLHRELALRSEVVARFEREAIAAGRIDDPHVVAAMDFGRLENGAFYLALEHVQGVDLAHVMARTRLDLWRAVEITKQILLALVAAHAAGVVHRDLKPENVMLVQRADQADFVKVLDFGIAKVTLEEQRESVLPGGLLTQFGSVFGTPEYMAPEQAAGLIVDHRADLYTVGVMLYEMLAGEPPFHDDDAGRVLEQQFKAPPPPLPEQIPGSLADLVLKQLSKDPNGRWQSAAELLEQLEGVIARMPRGRDGGKPQPEPRDQSAAPSEGQSDALAPARPRRPGLTRLRRVGGLVQAWWSRISHRVQHRASWKRLGMAYVGSLLLGVLLVVLWRPAPNPPGSRPLPAPVVEPQGGPADPAIAEVMGRASLGDPDALRALAARPEGQLSAPEWVALGRGHMELGQTDMALNAYGKALAIEPSLAQDRVIVAHVRQAAGEEATAEAALRLAALRLGSAGADLLYDVWVATRSKTLGTQLARQLVYSPEVRARASPALLVTLDLRQAETCDEIQRLLPRAILHGDTRVLRVLQPLTRKQGCGPGHREDCHGCLRRDDSLEKALQSAKRRMEPRF
jgi:hypothetical protein